MFVRSIAETPPWVFTEVHSENSPEIPHRTLLRFFARIPPGINPDIPTRLPIAIPQGIVSRVPSNVYAAIDEHDVRQFVNF